MPKLIGYVQSLFKIPVGIDLLRIHAVCQFCRDERKPVAYLSDAMET